MEEISAPSIGILDTLYVKLIGDEEVAGVKTFASFPITPSAAPTTNYQVANKKYVDDNILTVDEASEISIADAGGYYAGASVEAALQEIGAGTTLDGRYLLLDCSNDPLTGDLTLNSFYRCFGSIDSR